MYLTGFADEASGDLDVQIKATKELGWTNIESRKIGKANIHDISDEEFEVAVEKLEAAGVNINCFGSAIANWAKKIDEPMDSSIEETKRAIARMKRLGTPLVRIMSFAVLKDRGPDDQMEEERFRRVRELVSMFSDAGLLAVHENCMNYGGMGWTYTQKLLENVPGLKLVFDTGNPLFTADFIKDEPYPRQSSWEFYSHVKDHIAYVHIKDGKYDDEAGNMVYSYPGEGDGDVRRIVEDLIKSGYDGGISIEPHLAAVHHKEGDEAEEDVKYRTYVEYGRRMESILKDAGAKL